MRKGKKLHPEGLGQAIVCRINSVEMRELLSVTVRVCKHMGVRERELKIKIKPIEKTRVENKKCKYRNSMTCNDVEILEHTNPWQPDKLTQSLSHHFLCQG